MVAALCFLVLPLGSDLVLGMFGFRLFWAKGKVVQCIWDARLIGFATNSTVSNENHVEIWICDVMFPTLHEVSVICYDWLIGLFGKKIGFQGLSKLWLWIPSRLAGCLVAALVGFLGSLLLPGRGIFASSGLSAEGSQLRSLVLRMPSKAAEVTQPLGSHCESPRSCLLRANVVQSISMYILARFPFIMRFAVTCVSKGDQRYQLEMLFPQLHCTLFFLPRALCFGVSTVCSPPNQLDPSRLPARLRWFSGCPPMSSGRGRMGRALEKRWANWCWAQPPWWTMERPRRPFLWRKNWIRRPRQKSLYNIDIYRSPGVFWLFLRRWLIRFFSVWGSSDGSPLSWIV